MKLNYVILSISALTLFTSCTTSNHSKEDLAKLLKENPKILTEAIDAHPVEFIEALQKAARTAQDEIKSKQEVEEKKKLEDSFNKPIAFDLRKDETIRGNKDAPITLVEYSDFQCPFCSRSYETVQALFKKYDGKIRLIYKHLPLSFHDQAMISAKYYEAIRIQDENKAFKFHDEVFKNQKKLQAGIGFLDATAKLVGADMNRLKKDLNSELIAKRIEADMKEAAELGMQGTPGFLLNGIPVKGAYPLEYFVSLVDELQKRGKIKI